MIKNTLVVYGVRTINLDDHNEFIDTYESIYTTQELADEYITFTQSCMCNKCAPYKNTMHRVIPIIVVNELNIQKDEEDEEDENEIIKKAFTIMKRREIKQKVKDIDKDPAS